MTDDERDVEIQKLKDQLEAHEILLMVLGCNFPLVKSYKGPGGQQLLSKLLGREGLSPSVVTAAKSVLKKLDEFS